MNRRNWFLSLLGAVAACTFWPRRTFLLTGGRSVRVFCSAMELADGKFSVQVWLHDENDNKAMRFVTFAHHFVLRHIRPTRFGASASFIVENKVRLKHFSRMWRLGRTMPDQIVHDYVCSHREWDTAQKERKLAALLNGVPGA